MARKDAKGCDTWTCVMLDTGERTFEILADHYVSQALEVSIGATKIRHESTVINLTGRLSLRPTAQLSSSQQTRPDANCEKPAYFIIQDLLMRCRLHPGTRRIQSCFTSGDILDRMKLN